MNPQPESTPVHGHSRKANLQVVEPPRKPATHALVPREVRDAVLAGVRKHRHGIQAVAKRYGLAYNDVLDIVVEAAEDEKRAAYQQGLRVGRMNPWRPLPPASVAA